MKNIQSNMEKLNDLMKEAKSHCMCLDFSENSTHFIIIYPDGYFPNGLRVEKEDSKSKALKTAIKYMELLKGTSPMEIYSYVECAYHFDDHSPFDGGTEQALEDWKKKTGEECDYMGEIRT